MANHAVIRQRCSIGTPNHAHIQVVNQIPSYTALTLSTKLWRTATLPKTVEQHMKDTTRPALCDLLPVRDFLDDVMIRNNGSFVAGFKLSGSHTYFADD